MAGRLWHLTGHGFLRLRWPLAGLIALLIIVACILVVPQWLVDWELGVSARTLTAADRATAINDVRATLLQGIGGTVFLLGAYFTYRQLQTTREGQVTDRYTKAIDQLDKDKALAVRLGGLYALERIARDSRADRATIAEVLCAYARTAPRDPPASMTPVPPEANGRDADIGATSDARSRPLGVRAPDVQAAVTILGRWRTRLGETPPGVDLHGADLQGADLDQAQLQAATLYQIQLQQATLKQAQLQNANLNRVHLEGADLEAAQLQGARLGGARLQGAYLEAAQLQEANLYLRLQKAILVDAQMQEADLTLARLQEADLTPAQLQRQPSAMPNYRRPISPVPSCGGSTSAMPIYRGPILLMPSYGGRILVAPTSRERISQAPSYARQPSSCRNISTHGLMPEHSGRMGSTGSKPGLNCMAAKDLR